MKKTIRLIAVLLVTGLLVSCSSETDISNSETTSDIILQQQAGEAAEGSAIVLPFTHNDTLNPYLAKSKNNQELSLLLYDPLVKIDNNLNPVNCLAKDIKNNSVSYTAELVDAYFTDGSKLTADDVVYSVEQIKNAPDSKYFEGVSVIESCSAVKSDTVEFKLSRSCEAFEYCLNFPIIKSGTADLKDEDNKSLPPIGCGRYIFNSTDTGDFLAANDNWHAGSVNIKSITLSRLPDSTAVAHALQSGGIDIYYSDLKDNTFPSLLGGISHEIMRNNLVYLGVGRYSVLTSNSNLRYAVSNTIDRADIVKNSYFDQADAAAGPYHASFEKAQGLQLISPDDNRQAAEENLHAAGYAKDESGFYSKDGKRLSLVIACNSENSVRIQTAHSVAEMLTSLGLEVSVKELSYDEYTSAISSGSCDLYVAEVRLSSLFDLYPIFTAGGIISYSESQLIYKEESSDSENSVSADPEGDIPLNVTDKNPKTALQAAYAYYKGSGSMSEMLSCFNNDMPFIPICHHNAIQVCSAEIEGLTPSEYDPFYGIENAVLK